jgi:hypothetical protein
MTRLEREDLRRLARYQATLAKAAAGRRAAELRADFKEQLAAIFLFDDDAVWKAAMVAADEAVDGAKKRIAARCNELGIPQRFHPRSFNEMVIALMRAADPTFPNGGES